MIIKILQIVPAARMYNMIMTLYQKNKKKTPS